MKDNNGSTVEESMDRYGFTCLSDGRPARFDIRTLLCIKLSLASSELARVGEWDFMDRYTMGRDPKDLGKPC